MEALFVGFIMLVVGFYVFRYFWVYIQCKRAIGYANYLSKKHVYACADAFVVVNNSNMFEEQKDVLRGYIKKALNKSNHYWDEYNKDYDFNGLWMANEKWTLRQMFPNLTKRKGLEITYE